MLIPYQIATTCPQRRCPCRAFHSTDDLAGTLGYEKKVHMTNWNRMDVLVRERQTELRRAAERQRRIQAALAARQAGWTPAWGMLAAPRRRMLRWLGQRLQPTTTRC